MNRPTERAIHAILTTDRACTTLISQQKKDSYDNRGKALFWLQDPRDNTCLSQTGFGVCDEGSLWMLAERKEGSALVSPFETDNSDMCLVRKYCHSAESPAGLGQCKHCGAKHWAVTKDRRGYVKLSEHDGRNCLVRSKPSPKGNKFKRYKNSYELQHCDIGYTGLVLAKADLNDGFYLEAADGFCFDGERFVACSPNNRQLRWAVGVRFAGGRQAERYFYKTAESDVCLTRTGKGPRLGECSRSGAKRWSLEGGRLAHEGKHCVVRLHDNSAALAKCSEGHYEHLSPVPYQSSMPSSSSWSLTGGAGGARLPLGY